MQTNTKFIEATGTVIETLPNTTFKVEIDNGAVLLCHVAGKMRKYRIRIIPGDQVRLEISPYDLTQGRIVYRGKARKN